VKKKEYDVAEYSRSRGLAAMQVQKTPARTWYSVLAGSLSIQHEHLPLAGTVYQAGFIPSRVFNLLLNRFRGD
jgi:hypothetical protein